MRSVLLAVLFACVPEDPGQNQTPSEDLPDPGCQATCGGCCAGTVCRPGTALGACGEGGAACVACGAGKTCSQQQCVDVPKIAVTLNWQYETGISSCAVDDTRHYCTASAAMTQERFAALTSVYPSCTFTGQTITCVNCTSVSNWCGPMPGGRYKTSLYCTHLDYTGYDECTWNPPAY